LLKWICFFAPAAPGAEPFRQMLAGQDRDGYSQDIGPKSNIVRASDLTDRCETI